MQYAMADNAFVRRDNLRRLCNARGLKPADLRRIAGRRRGSYWSDLLKNDDKPFGEKAARSIEDDLGLPRCWLDQPEAIIPAGGTAADTPALYVVPRWPWGTDLFVIVDALDHDEMARLEAVIRAHLGHPRRPP